jgi:hypothetical protein
MRTIHAAIAPMALAALLLFSSPNPLAVDRAIAVTFDDLPATEAGAIANDVESLEALTRRAADRRAGPQCPPLSAS